MRSPVGNEIREGALFFAYWHLERHRLPRRLNNLAHAIRRGAHGSGDLIDGWLATGCLLKLARLSVYVADQLDHMYRHPDRASLVRDCAGHCLPDPPIGVGAEPVALGIVEFL